ncbi:hypothetical protein BN938_1255 [Mucinivorans hirudinis]|uniref:Uncharacterized protein n=1 Tax=Mucinivorans hirudinis TaxID=1433126 RepID=A0A060RC64_9BACT|nr:hypothetical protein BN938_1255 [Mucinivorans hirudinis]
MKLIRRVTVGVPPPKADGKVIYYPAIVSYAIYCDSMY